jgi:hypothetical protein
LCKVHAGCLCDKLSVNALSCANSSALEYHQLRVHLFPNARYLFILVIFVCNVSSDSEKTHQLTNPDIIRESCKLYDSNCVDLGKVEPCKPDEVRCLMSGACLSPEWRCNGVNDCGFWEDEVNCQGIFFPKKTPYFYTMLRVFPEGNLINLFATKVSSVNLIKFH